MIRYLPVVLDLVLTVVAIVDIVLIDNSRVRGLPKWGWIMLSIILFLIGPLLWFFVGRERLEPRNHGRYASEAPIHSTPRSGSGSASRAPDDDPEFLARLRREREQVQRIRELERELEERRATDDRQKPDDPKPAE
jgi:hypothetical protein